ncbi:MAG: hypothetical protein Q9165_007008 [Trypethelium subeluteriae]
MPKKASKDLTANAAVEQPLAEGLEQAENGKNRQAKGNIPTPHPDPSISQHTEKIPPVMHQSETEQREALMHRQQKVCVMIAEKRAPSEVKMLAPTGSKEKTCIFCQTPIVDTLWRQDRPVTFEVQREVMRMILGNLRCRGSPRDFVTDMPETRLGDKGKNEEKVHPVTACLPDGTTWKDFGIRGVEEGGTEMTSEQVNEVHIGG